MRHRLRQARIATSGVFFANGTGLGLWAGHIPVVQQGLEIDAGLLSIALLSLALGAVLAMSMTGSCTARFGSPSCTAVAGATYGLALALPVLAPGFGTLIAAALLLGAANGATDVAMNTQASTVERSYGRPVMSSFHACFSLGGMAGALIAGALLALGSDPAIHLPVFGVLIAIVMAFAGTRLVRGAEEGGGGFAMPGSAALGIGLLALMSLLAEGAIMDWSAVYLATIVAAPPATATLGYAAFSIAMMTGRLTGDAVVGRLGRSRALVISGLLASGGITIATGVGTLVAGVIGFGIAGLGLANAVPILFSTAARLPGVAPGMGVAMVATLGYAGFLLGPPAIGFIAEASSLRWALLVILPAMLIVSLLGPRLVGVGRAATTTT
jgi:MFS family permease